MVSTLLTVGPVLTLLGVVHGGPGGDYRSLLGLAAIRRFLAAVPV